jgi:hypothetical protein
MVSEEATMTYSVSVIDSNIAQAERLNAADELRMLACSSRVKWSK